MLTSQLGSPGESTRVDRNPGVLMAVHVAFLSEVGETLVYAVAHYFESTGDLIPDPCVVIARTSPTEWVPLSFENYLARLAHAEVDAEGVARLLDPRGQVDLTQFCELWMKNIIEQQELRL